MKRIIVDFKKLTPEILSLLVEKYPDGYDNVHIITFKNAKSETVKAVEVRTEDTIYLVKVSQKLENTMANFDEDDYEVDEFDEPIIDIPDESLLKDELGEDLDEDEDED